MGFGFLAPSVLLSLILALSAAVGVVTEESAVGRLAVPGLAGAGMAASAAALAFSSGSGSSTTKAMVLESGDHVISLTDPIMPGRRAPSPPARSISQS